MCDYSLHSIENRLAVEGEQLVVHRFPTNSIGMASIADVPFYFQGEPDYTSLKGVWSGFRLWLRTCFKEPACAVCIPPGARLVLRDIPERIRQQYGVAPEEEVTFTQLSVSTNCYRDAIRFKTGVELLLQRLTPGQRVDVLSLAIEEPVPSPVRSGALARWRIGDQAQILKSRRLSAQGR